MRCGTGAGRRRGCMPRMRRATRTAIAVIDERESVTFAEIDRRSSIVAAALAEQGVGAGDAVALAGAQLRGVHRRDGGRSASSARTCCTPTPASPVRSSATCSTSENAAAIIADDEFAEHRREHAGDAAAAVGVGRRRRRAGGQHRRAGCRGTVTDARRRLPSPGARGPPRHPHQRHDRPPEGRSRGLSQRPVGRGQWYRPARRDPLPAGASRCWRHRLSTPGARAT